MTKRKRKNPDIEVQELKVTAGASPFCTLLLSHAENNKEGGICDDPDLKESGVYTCTKTENVLAGDDINRARCGDLTPERYAIIHVPRKRPRRGGVEVVHKNAL